MMLPYLRGGRRAAVCTQQIGGLCLTEEWQSGDLAYGNHLSTDGSPGLTPRETPVLLAEYEHPQALLAGGRGIAADGKLYWEGAEIGTLTAGFKQTATVGNKLCIFPDKKYVDIDTGQLFDMEAACALTDVVFETNGIAKTDFAWPFAAGDAVEISGCIDHKQNNQTLIIRRVDENGVWFDDNVLEAGSESGEVILMRSLPDLTVVCESGNRLWGCSGNTIYGSKLGDPLNFSVYDGLSTDSYALTVSGDGDFTACSPYGSHIIFFKTDMAYKLYGTRPANYQLMTAQIPGVRPGCAGTLWTDSEDLYYLGREGLYAYAGGVPQLISQELGDIEGDTACGGVWMGKYYLSAIVGGRAGIFTYDLRRRLWLPWEINIKVVGFGRREDQFYILSLDGRLLTPGKDIWTEDWMAELRPFRNGDGRTARCTSVVLDADVAEGAWLALDWAGRDGVWKQAALFDGHRQGLRSVRLLPNRGSQLRLRLRGFGKCHVRSIERHVTWGGVEE